MIFSLSSTLDLRQPNPILPSRNSIPSPSSTATMSTHNIVILGASYSGMGVAHGLLKELPALKKKTGKTYKIFLLANSTHFWFSVGAPRAMLKPYPNDIMDSFIPVKTGFEQYPSELYEFVHAEITDLDTGKREVYYKLKDEKEDLVSDTKTMHFDTLVIATGAKGPSPLYSYHGSHVPTLQAYKDVQGRVPSAKSVMIVGGGAAGTETAGEVGYLYGKKSKAPKDITFLSGNERLLTALRPAIAKRAQEFLDAMGVKVEHNLRLKDSKPLDNGSTQVSLSDGSTRTVDLLINATGRKPASSYLPSSLLDQEGRVKVDAYNRVPTLKSVYVAGDMASNSPGGIIYIKFATPVTSGNIIAELSGKGEGKVYKPITTKEMQFVPVGPEQGVGAAFGWWVPSTVVKMVKSKTFMFDQAQKTVMGTA